MITALFQAASFFVIAALAVAWVLWLSAWFRSTDRPVRLDPIVVHGAGEQAAGLGQAIALGIVGSISEHRRDVEFINQAIAHVAESNTLFALTRISRPTPELLAAAEAPEALDIAVEVAGAKVDAKGLQALFTRDGPKPGTLSIAVFLAKDGTTGRANSSFPANHSYGFSLPVTGELDEIARQIGMRFVQAYYATEDPFYAALDPQDFRLFWEARKRAAVLALRSAGEATRPDRKLPHDEALVIRRDIAHLLTRYRRRPEMQKLGAYLATMQGDYVAAIEFLSFAQAEVDNLEGQQIGELIARLRLDAETEAATPPATTASAAPTDLVAQIRAQAVLADLRAAHVAEPGSAVRVAIIAGSISDFSAVFGDRIAPLSDADAGGDAQRSYTNGIAGLIAALAPSAEIRTVKILDPNGGATTADILRGIERIAVSDFRPDVVLIPLGPLQGDVVWEVIRGKLFGRGFAVVAPAGNAGAEISLPGADLPGMIYVGAADHGTRASYSNFGPDVTLFAPSQLLSFELPDRLASSRGTSVAASVVTAVAANLIAESRARGEALSNTELVDALLGRTTEVDGIRVLSPAPDPGAPSEGG